MSNRPDNPFQTSGPGTMHGDRQPKKGNVWLWVIGIIGGIMVLGALVCCGGTFFAYRAGTNMLAEQFKNQLSGNPTIVEHVGDIQSMSLNLSETSTQAESSGGALAFDVVGSKSNATLLIKQAPGGDGTSIGSAELLMPDGTRYPVAVDSMDDNLDIDMGEDFGGESGTTTSDEFEVQLNEFNQDEPAPAQ